MTRSIVRYVLCVAAAVAAGVAGQYAPAPVADPLRLIAVVLALVALWDVASSRTLQRWVWIERKGFRDDLVWIAGDWRVLRP